MSCFQNHCYGANNYALRIFVDAFQGHYKDGTEPGTRDCRWFAGIYFLGRIMALYIIFGVEKNFDCYTLIGFILMIIGMLIIVLQPFRSSNINKYHALLPLIMAIGCLSITLLDQVESKVYWMINIVLVLIGIFYASPIVAVIIYIGYRCYRRFHTLWLNRRPEMENLVTRDGNQELNYQAINID